MEPARGLFAGDDLHLRDFALRRLAQAGLGRRPGPARLGVTGERAFAAGAGAEDGGPEAGMSDPAAAARARERVAEVMQNQKPEIPQEKEPARMREILKIRARKVDFYYGPKKVLQEVSIDIREKQITALIG